MNNNGALTNCLTEGADQVGDECDDDDEEEDDDAAADDDDYDVEVESVMVTMSKPCQCLTEWVFHKLPPAQERESDVQGEERKRRS